MGLDQATVDGAVVHKTPLPPNIRVRALGLLAKFLVVIGLTAAALLVAWGWPERTARAGDRGRDRPLGAYWRGRADRIHAAAHCRCRRAGPAAHPGHGRPSPARNLRSPGAVVGDHRARTLSGGRGSGGPDPGRLLPGRRGMYGAIVLGSALVGVLWFLPIVSWLVPVLLLPLGLGAWILGWREISGIEGSA